MNNRNVEMALGKIDDIFRGVNFFVQKSRKGKSFISTYSKVGRDAVRTVLHFIVSEPSGHVIFRFRSAKLAARRARSTLPKLSTIHSQRSQYDVKRNCSSSAPWTKRVNRQVPRMLVRNFLFDERHKSRDATDRPDGRMHVVIRFHTTIGRWQRNRKRGREGGRMREQIIGGR